MVGFSEEFKKIKEVFLRLKTKREMQEDLLSKKEQELFTKEEILSDHKKARVVVQSVATIIQKHLEYKITNIVTIALSSVFPEIEFKVKFVERRNQTECDMMFVSDGNEFDPMDASGGGAIDIASIALRMAIWSLKKTRAVQILDEPSRNLSRDKQAQVSEILSTLSKELGLQMIIVSHIPELMESADRIIQVDQIDNYSTVIVKNKGE